MQTKFMKWASLASLIVVAVFWNQTTSIQLPLRSVVCLGAILVARQAFRLGKKSWAAGFCAIGLAFNPFLAGLSLSGDASLALVLSSALAFAVSLTAIRSQPLLSIPSITGRTPGSESL